MTRKRTANEQSSQSKPASKHQLRGQTVAKSDLTEDVTSASETDEEDNQAEGGSESNGSLPDMNLKDAAARDGESSDEEYSEPDDGEDEDRWRCRDWSG